jgi:hypothetical protein
MSGGVIGSVLLRFLDPPAPDGEPHQEDELAEEGDVDELEVGVGIQVRAQVVSVRAAVLVADLVEPARVTTLDKLDGGPLGAGDGHGLAALERAAPGRD